MDGKEWYQAMLRRPEWLVKRREIYERDDHRCVDCGRPRGTGVGLTIECHHTYYVSGKKPWEYPAEALVTVCGGCHDKRHKTRIMVHASQRDAEMWLLFTELEAAMLEEELKRRDERIDRLERKGAVWESEGRYYGLVDKKGRERFFDEDGNEM
jgi:hypothetical protein